MAVGLLPPKKLLPIRGIRIATTSAGIYVKKRQDLALIAMDPSSSSTAVFTKNAFAAAPVILARQHLLKETSRYCLINAGNANAGTGNRGIEDAKTTCSAVATIGNCEPESVLPFSTGIIGEHLPTEKISIKLNELNDSLSEDKWMDLAQAIMTTDTVAKGVSRQIQINGQMISITGVAKGAGMIRPDMATMLAFIGTDAAIERKLIDEILLNAVEKSFNRICVDGDMSTNDACVLIATGASEMKTISDTGSAEYCQLQEAINEVCQALAQTIVRDGEGASKYITVLVEQGKSKEECLAVAYAIATSPLIKTAFFASDPNWGRILAAVGRAGLQDLDINGISIYLNEVRIVTNGGRDCDYKEAAGTEIMSKDEITLKVLLGRGNVTETIWTCDFSHEYVKINAEYRT